MKKTDSDNQYAVSIKEDTAYLCLHFTKDHEGNKINTPYPENPIRRIQVIECEDSGRYRTWSLLQEIPNTMDDRNITMEEYSRLEEEKARRRAIVFNDELSSEKTLSCEPTVSSLNNNEIDFRISFDESDDEDYMAVWHIFGGELLGGEFLGGELFGGELLGGELLGGELPKQVAV
ncbi:hypothetical protein Tco_0513297 [Tanacetum coccineum]